MKYQVSLLEAVEALASKEEMFVRLMQYGKMSVEYYAPVKFDHQKPHEQDELYIITSRSGIFVRGGEKTSFKKGDVIFVPAGMDHHFKNFTDDFATWVVFYGS